MKFVLSIELDEHEVHELGREVFTPENIAAGFSAFTKWTLQIRETTRSE